jgi:uncharacterized protein (DUF433 family)
VEWLKEKGRMSSDENPPQRAQIRQPASWIQKTAGICGGDACIRNTRITVWGLVQRRKQGLSDAELLRRIPGVTLADLKLAWDYYQRNCAEIDQAIQDNKEA